MFGVLIPIGPAIRDVGRAERLVDELARHERVDEISLILVDDAPAARSLHIEWPLLQVVRTPLWEKGGPDPFSAMVTGTLEGLQCARRQELDFVVKLDTDAAIVAPFSDALRRAFADRGVGVVGSYDVTSGGGRRDWSIWDARLTRASWPVIVLRDGRRGAVRRRSRADRAYIRGIRSAAYAFAPRGAHCLGGAYAVSSALFADAPLDWRPWLKTGLSEDVVVGLLASASRLRMKSLTGPGEPFGLAWRGLPASPQAIAREGHSILHSVKRETAAEEQDLVDLLHQLTATAVVTSPDPGHGSDGM